MRSQDIQPETPLILGFDISGTKIGIVAGILEGKNLDRVELTTPRDCPFDVAFDQMMKTASEIFSTLETKGFSASEAISVAIGGP